MKRTLVLGILVAIGTSPLPAETQSELTLQARGLVKQFGGQLKTELQKGMKSGGPVNAIGVCNEKAPGIAQAVANGSGWSIGRTSLKLRNPDNHPDAWEQQVLQQFEKQLAEGADPGKLEFSQVLELNGRKQFRYMKAIPTGKVCLNCHGSEIKPEVTAKLDQLYPANQARGFRLGQLRGAFTLEQDL